ncbi:serine/threonine-protein kinase [Enhygromyxa salina]|uniref:Serine/threonine-protein kinase PknB n=1 Tax=Enhygromyxa salina TaxID=215803 RepID=A0A2S9Y845_9BACT|nr:serine/threonine-protein kinase [Enhygromyxa salina]PRQ01191.1 Serine/threonine-protein kinase PknB [Enhygromyxa salina]
MPREVEATAKLAPCPHCAALHDEDLLRCDSTDLLLPLEGRRLDGKFRFLSALGSGGMATVYLAVNERVDREVAIKFLRPEVGRDPEAVARFRSEAKAAGRIGSQHICEILDLGDSPIGPYIVMERLRGIDLAQLIRRQGRLRPGYAVRVVRHTLEGLAAAHAAGIVHRDLKPANIFLHRTESGDTVVKLMDFGVSKFLDGTGEAQTGSGILLGTPEYMAPEQLEGANKLGPSSDLWAMGAILYRAITGHQVFSGPTLVAVIRSMALDEVTPLSRLVEGVPAELETIIHRCLQRDIAARFQTAEELSEALEPFETLEVDAVPIPQPESTRELSVSALEVVTDDAVESAGESETAIWRERELAEQAKAPIVAAQLAAAPTTNSKLAVGIVAAVVVVVGALWLYFQDPAPTPAPTPGEQARIGESASETSGAPPLDLAAGADPAGQSTTEIGETGELANSGETETGELEDSGETETEIETETGEADPSADTGGGAWEAATERPAPSGTFRAGPYIAPNEPGSNSDLAAAKATCANLASTGYAGESGWKLANPAQLAKFIGNNKVKRGRYWTTALNKGRAWTYSMPGGKKTSEKAERSVARALCVMKY